MTSRPDGAAAPAVRCPVCDLPLPPGETVCTGCGEDLAPLVKLRLRPVLLRNEARRCLARGDTLGALAALRQAAMAGADDPRTLVLLGKVYGQRGEQDAAAAVLRQALALAPAEEDLAAARAALAALAPADSGEAGAGAGEEASRRRPVAGSTTAGRASSRGWRAGAALATAFVLGALAMFGALRAWPGGKGNVATRTATATSPAPSASPPAVGTPGGNQ